MKTTIYIDAVKEVQINKISEFLKTQDELVTIDDWSTLRAPKKREQFLEALGMSLELRKNFVTFYNTVKEAEADWTDWEDAETTAEVPDAEIVEETPAKTTKITKPKKAGLPATSTFGISPAGTPAGLFVEGAFEQIVADAAGLNAEQSTSALKSVEEDLELQHMKIGVLLGHITASEHYMTMGYQNMREYLDAETGIGYRKAMHLIQNANMVRDLGIPSEKLKGVTWSALRHIIPVLTGQNYTTWLEAARSMKHVALIQPVNEEKVKIVGGTTAKPSNHPPAETVQKIFSVKPDQKLVIDQAIEKAKVEGNTDNAGAALEVIAAAYSGAPPSKSSVALANPDLTNEGLASIFSKIISDEGNEGVVRILEAMEPLAPNVTISVEFDVPLAATA